MLYVKLKKMLNNQLLYKIEFIEGEQVCRFDGELGDSAWMI